MSPLVLTARHRPISLVALLVLTFLLAGATWRQATPTIASLSVTQAPRSGRLLIQGAGFGDDPVNGEVTIAGLTAFVTRWSDLSITAYVPEAASLGPAAVSVEVGGGRSNDVPLDVIARASQGRVQWRFQVDSDYILQRPAVGPDGTVVVADSSGWVYALSPEGGLKWIHRAGGVAGPPAIGADGSVFVAAGNQVQGLAPDGTLRWQFTDPDSQGAVAGPGVGPDGNIYVVNDLFGVGAVSLDPAGRLLWSHPGSPRFTEYGALGSEVVFSPATAPAPQFYFGLDEYGVSSATVFGMGVDGQQAWARSAGASSDPFMQQQQQVAVAPAGTIYVTSLNSASGWGLRALDPANGATLWTYSPWPANGMSPPDVGPNGVVYLARSLAYLDAVNATGRVVWSFNDGSVFDRPVVNQAGTLVVVGSRPAFGEPGFVRAFNAANGSLRWSVPLGIENGGTQIAYTRPRFSADDRTIYVGTAILGGNASDPYSYLYAIKTTDASAAPGEAGVARPMTVRPGAGSSLVVDYGPACNAAEHAIYWGTAPAPGAMHWVGCACGVGAGAGASFDPGTPPVGTVYYFVVVGRNGANEGSYGRSSSGAERPEAVGIGACDAPRVIATSCAP
ncbi:MAG TPA: PQQ-binding-like beta-propeller repeat protein [Candidatus Polarisedimenticolia bacterium]|nr:PQQ-binding-like beta-propeller repeat protein [Candidatus Polarisedimenticolia bacterium]